jgi:excisionase family DNA binding protein
MPPRLAHVDNELLSTADAAKILGLSADMVRLLAREGRLQPAAQTTRGLRLFRREDVEELAAERAGTANGRHTVQFYEADEFLSGTVGSVISGSLRAGAPVVLIATAPHRDAFIAHLEQDGIDVRAACESRQLSLHDARALLDSFLVDGMPDRDRFQATVGEIVRESMESRPRARMRAYGEMVDILWTEGRMDAAIRLEELWNELGRGQTFSLLCSYRLDSFRDPDQAERFMQVCGQHSHVLPAESYRLDAKLEESMREIALLQQQARSLENEVKLRRETEEALRAALAERERAELAMRSSEEKLRQQNQSLHDAASVKDEFLARIGHELRNPLAPIRTALELLRMRGESSREHGLIDRHVGYLTRLVDDLLDVSRLTRGKIDLRKERVGVDEVVARAIEGASPLLELRGHRLAIDVPAGLAVDVDPERMAQVVVNLLTNAAKYSDRGSLIQITAVRAGAAIRLSVVDEGIGIAPDMLGSVFDSFVQEPRAIEQTGGLGLGLTIVRSLVLLHGGRVSVESEGQGRGSTFSFEIPAADLAVLPPVRPLDPAFPARAERGRRVLVVDDNADLASLIGELLQHLGHEVELAHDGPSALAAAARFLPDVALLDIGLPGMDGYELAGRLRSLRGSLRLVAISGYGQATDRKRSEEAGFADHLVKPVTPDHLASVVSLCSVTSDA